MKREFGLLVAALAACGGIATSPDSGISDGSADVPSSFDDAGLSDCYSAQGHRVCRGTHQCPEPEATCGVCFKWGRFIDASIDDPTVGICSKGTGFTSDGCYLAPDGNVCFSFQDLPGIFGFLTAPYATAILFLNNGGSIERVRYADGSVFTGTPLPQPLSCPTLPVGRVCGGNCGGCADGEICHGRSPTHPYSYCIPIKGTSHGCDPKSPKCDPDEGCFILDDGGAPTAVSGFCVPVGMCKDLAQNLPGGGTCLAP